MRELHGKLNIIISRKLYMEFVHSTSHVVHEEPIKQNLDQSTCGVVQNHVPHNPRKGKGNLYKSVSKQF